MKVSGMYVASRKLIEKDFMFKRTSLYLAPFHASFALVLTNSALS